MGPEEIHIYFFEGAPHPPKSKSDRPKNLEVFFSQFSNPLSCMNTKFQLPRGRSYMILPQPR